MNKNNLKKVYFMTLNIYTLMNGAKAPFVGAAGNELITLSAFTYNATRMGSAPTISATLMYQDCLDDYWSDAVFVEYRGERYFLKQIPTSSYSNEKIMYKHELIFVSERVALENVYFYDVVDADFDDDKPVSNRSEFTFSGNIYQFAERLNQSLKYADLEYRVVVDDGIESEDKVVTVENKFFSAVLQDIYNVYDIPYYFVGKVIHIGHSSNAIDEVFRYGAEDALLSISKNNAGNRIINRVTGLGSEENIPYYYPNLSPKGNIIAKAGENNAALRDEYITIVNYEQYAEKVALDGVITYAQGYWQPSKYYIDYGRGKMEYTLGSTFDIDKTADPYTGVPVRLYIKIQAHQQKCNIKIAPPLHILAGNAAHPVNWRANEAFIVYEGQTEDTKQFLQQEGYRWYIYNVPVGLHEICLTYNVSYLGVAGIYQCSIPDFEKVIQNVWYYEDEPLETYQVGNNTYIKDFGLKVSGPAVAGDTITQMLAHYIEPQPTLMPPLYRSSGGVERFYNALNNTYQNPEEDEGIYYEFENPFVEGRPKEQIVQFPEVKPTIKEVKNSDGLRIDMFSEFAYDRDDNDDIYNDADGQTNYTHPYFFGKLRKLDFNLFDYATESDMTISMTSGNCGSCEFVIGVDSDTKKNTVQVDSDGNLVYDENGNVLCGREDFQPQVTEQDEQQDTINNEVWIALKKDTKTFGEIMPNVTNSYYPKACSNATSNDGDTFVILNINMPQKYIEKAEEELLDQTIRFMYDNNFEKFNFSIKFSRIYLAEHPEIFELLDENARITIEYNGQQYTLYVSSFTHKVTNDSPLPEITVELKDNLAVSQNAVQRTVDKATEDIYKTIGNIDVVVQANPYFLRSDQMDTAYKQITFVEPPVLRDGLKVNGGDIKSADYVENTRGLAIKQDDSGNWHIESDFLTARKKISAKEVEIQRTHHIGGAQIKSSASMICSRVEDAGDAYRCYMNTTDDDGNTIYNEFVSGDQAYVQTFNLVTDADGNTTNHFYWRLVIEVGDNFILLSKDICAEGSTVPMAGDHIVQLGCQDESRPERMVAVIDAGAGADAPYYRQFVGINSFSLPEPETQLKPNDNVLTGKIVAKAGSVLPISTRNLLSNSKEIVADDNLAVSHGFVFATMPLPESLELKQGDKLTFKTEEFKVTLGTATKGEISLFTYDAETNSPINRVSEPAYISVDNLTVTLTVDYAVTPRSADINNNTNYALLLYAGVWSNTYGNRVEYTKCSLVEGEYPLAVWSDSPEDQVNTTIDNGIITSGTIQLGDSNATAKAGITGTGDSDKTVRIWAGSSETTKDNAPFRVQQDGTLFASKGVFSGLVSKTPTILTKYNYTNYVTSIDGDNYWIDLTKTGSFIVVDDWFNIDDEGVYLHLPTISPNIQTSITLTENDKDALRGLIGQTIIVKNISENSMYVCTEVSCSGINANAISYFTLKAESYSSSVNSSIVNQERLYWDAVSANIS
jgi:hypothetical protein